MNRPDDVLASKKRRALVTTALNKTLGKEPSRLRFAPLHGGNINISGRLLVDEQTFFLKWNDRPLPRQFEVEATGLQALASAQTDLVIPKVVSFSDAVDASYLLLRYLPPGRPALDFDERLGRALAALHRQSSAQGFGFWADGYCGATPQPNRWRKRWVDFYLEHRLGHQIELANLRGCDRSARRHLERVADCARTLLDDDEPPALIHGDLWSGNLHVTAAGGPALLDPAAYFGHREAELGMMVLFGGFSARVFSAYDEAWPLRVGWQERQPLYTLYHVLNHYTLFGGGYLQQALDLTKRYAG